MSGRPTWILKNHEITTSTHNKATKKRKPTKQMLSFLFFGTISLGIWVLNCFGRWRDCMHDWCYLLFL